jgi:hypothetical protein
MLEWLPLEHNVPSSQWSLHCNWYYSELHWDSSSTWKMTYMWCLFYSLHNNSKSLWTQWGQEVAQTMNFYCIIALQLWQHMGLDASWSRGQHWLTTVYCQLLFNRKGRTSQCSITHHARTARGISNQPHMQDTFCSTKKSQLPEAFTLLWCYTAYIRGWLPMFWDSLISHIFKGQFFGFLDAWNWTNMLS